jgi:hypothetical protein
VLKKVWNPCFWAKNAVFLPQITQINIFLPPRAQRSQSFFDTDGHGFVSRRHTQISPFSKRASVKDSFSSAGQLRCPRLPQGMLCIWRLTADKIHRFFRRRTLQGRQINQLMIAECRLSIWDADCECEDWLTDFYLPKSSGV